jgi:hypothetical protein
LRTGADPDLGIYLDPKTFRLETRTKSRGTITVDYEAVGGAWVPSRMAQRVDHVAVVVDQMEYEPPRGTERPRLRGFVINVGDEKARPHSDVTVTECRSY